MKYYICTIIKDELLYLEEWIQYHLSIGFTDIFLFEDYESTSHKEITDKYPQVHLTTCDEYFLIKRDYDIGTSRQFRLYHKFQRNNMGDVWCAFIDVDEFIQLEEGETLENICKDFSNENGIALFWKMYGANGHIKRPEGKIMDNYTKECNLPFYKGWNFKSFMNLSKKNTVLTVHSFKNIVDIDKIPVEVNKDNEIKHKRIWINHYFTKSFEDWLYRFNARGDLLPNNRKKEQFFELNPDMEKLHKYCIKEQNKRQFFPPYFTWLGNDNYALVISKCGSTTLRKISAIAEGKKIDVQSKWDYHRLATLYPKEIIKGNKIAVWRDPVERLLSFYKSNILTDKTNYLNIKTFKDCIKEVKKEYKNTFKIPFLVDQHLRKQSDYYTEDEVDIIVKLEDLDDYLKTIGVNNVEHINISESEYIPTKEEIKLIKEFYADDYKILESPKLWKNNQ